MNGEIARANAPADRKIPIFSPLSIFSAKKNKRKGFYIVRVARWKNEDMLFL